MKLFTRTLVATTIAMGLAACGSDDKKESPVDNSAVVYSDNATITGVAETVQITNINGETENVQIEAYKGLRFAKAERFQHSQLMSPKGDISAKAFGDICPQTSASIATQSEDCLNLNIWRPANIENDRKLPVYVFIHGGSFETGSGSHKLNRGDVIVAQSVSDTTLGERTEPFIAVTLNYRLGMLGSLHSEEATGGNYGLGDQKRALEWVKSNIDIFGGDSTNVTVFGQDAGAMSIGIIQQATANEDDKQFDYFDRAIMQSNPIGLALKDSSAAESVKNTITEFAAQQYQTTLDKLSVEEIVEVQQIANRADKKLIGWFTSAPNTSSVMPFAPYIEVEEGDENRTGQVQVVEQPYQTQFQVPTVLSYNKYDSSKFASILDLTFLYNLSDDDGNPLLIPELGFDESITTEDVLGLMDKLLERDDLSLSQRLAIIAAKAVVEGMDIDVTIRQNLYNVIPRLFFGLLNNTASGALKLADYAPNDDKQLLDDGALSNITKYHKLMNDVIYACAGYSVAQNQERVPVSLYQYDFKAGFSVNPLDLDFPEDVKQDPMGIIDPLNGTLKSVGCIAGKACNSAELPFVFNKNYNVNEQKMLSLSNSDKALQQEMSRRWFSDDLFSHVSDPRDVMVVTNEGRFDYQSSWDEQYNQSIDPSVSTGLCTALGQQDILFDYMSM
ncbi:carboxylesterase family protein [Photobacterium rosenbergii]|uniref:Carboxylesterase family protein n=1 Tax=Photobacterium rosenbergii TaxID=294936 RepID=A0ABU3ZEL4_9GAMM|nr:carboxylesterase family protein [Photobacterium rosenbergii]MDV5168536.1 carboxylesterase family protein [Photobacterium rosenbergii]